MIIQNPDLIPRLGRCFSRVDHPGLQGDAQEFLSWFTDKFDLEIPSIDWEHSISHPCVGDEPTVTVDRQSFLLVHNLPSCRTSGRGRKHDEFKNILQHCLDDTSFTSVCSICREYQ